MVTLFHFYLANSHGAELMHSDLVCGNTVYAPAVMSWITYRGFQVSVLIKTRAPIMGKTLFCVRDAQTTKWTWSGHLESNEKRNRARRMVV